MNGDFYLHVLFDLQLISTFAMIGVIWVIQLVHYPSFSFIEEKNFVQFSKFHQTRVTYIVAPLMFIELLTAVSLVVLKNELLFVINFVFLLFIWISTFFYFISAHTDLSKGKDPVKIKELVLLNWARTIFWTLCGIILSYYLFIGV